LFGSSEETEFVEEHATRIEGGTWTARISDREFGPWTWISELVRWVSMHSLGSTSVADFSKRYHSPWAPWNHRAWFCVLRG